MQSAPDNTVVKIDRAATVNHLIEPLRGFLALDGVTELCINRPGEVFIERNNAWERHDTPELDYHRLRSIGIAVAAYTHNELSDSHPILSAVLPGDERVQIVLPPACEENTISITMRKPSKETRSLTSYEQAGYFKRVRWTRRMTPDPTELDADELDLLRLASTNEPAAFLRQCIASGKVIVVAGATGSGKTTFMKALMLEIPVATRLITIEDVRELFLPKHPNHVHLFYPSEAKATDGAPVTAPTLLKSCMRMKPDRILLAELRGGETLDFIDACMTGHSGSITSVHANSATMAFPRMAKMALKSEFAAGQNRDELTEDLRSIVDVVIHVTKACHGSAGQSDGTYHATEIYFDPMRKRYPDGKIPS